MSLFLACFLPRRKRAVVIVVIKEKLRARLCASVMRHFRNASSRWSKWAGECLVLSALIARHRSNPLRS